MKDKNIVIDFDSTIINTPKTLINIHNKLYPSQQYIYKKNMERKIDWNFYPLIKTKEELKELFKLFDHPDFYKHVEVFPKAIETINKLAETNNVYICSKHMESRKPLTLAWINKVMPKVKVIFVDNFSDKGETFKDIKVDIVIDDRIDCLSSFNDSIFKILFGGYKWNKFDDFSEEEKEGIVARVFGWIDVKYILKLYEEVYE